MRHPQRGREPDQGRPCPYGGRPQEDLCDRPAGRRAGRAQPFRRARHLAASGPDGGKAEGRQHGHPDGERAHQMSATPGRVADSTGNWVDGLAPPWARPYLKLARFDRPIGAWLLLFPCWWSQALAEHALDRAYPHVWYLVLFYVGAFVMRGAGCTYNDIVDRDYDARVARTAGRPIPSGQVSVRQAWAFALAQGLIGFLILLVFNRFAIVLGASSLL